MNDTSPECSVDAVRQFNRFYSRKLGLFDEGLPGSPFSLAEARVLFDLATHPDCTAARLGAELELDSGYLSRVLRGLEDRGLLTRRPSETDGRHRILSLTKKGRQAFASLEDRSRDQVAAMLDAIPVDKQRRLVAAMRTIAKLFEPAAEPKKNWLIRTHQPGDMGWVVHRHGVLYSQEYGWDERFEALVAEIVAKFVQNFNPGCERCWLAELDAEVVGSVFLVQQSEKIAKLRLLLVEPSARGLGIGRRLVEECIAFARRSGYKKITLWTNSVLHAARCLYEDAGFQMTKEEAHQLFGHDLLSETWELPL